MSIKRKRLTPKEKRLLTEDSHPEEIEVKKRAKTVRNETYYKDLYESTDFTQQEINDARAILEYRKTREILPNIN